VIPKSAGQLIEPLGIFGNAQSALATLRTNMALDTATLVGNEKRM
ncbi:unnamed protein product, partial [Acidithrix sp. C25]